MQGLIHTGHMTHTLAMHTSHVTNSLIHQRRLDTHHIASFVTHSRLVWLVQLLQQLNFS